MLKFYLIKREILFAWLLIAALIIAVSSLSYFLPPPKATLSRTSESLLSKTGLGHPVFLIHQEGNDKIDLEISELQKHIGQSTHPAPLIGQLGWKFVSKARLSNDPGYYKLAESCAVFLTDRYGNVPEPLLLQGHIYDALHRFKDAEVVARKLLVLRQTELDYALLGDSLMEQGRLEEAVGVYQKMIDTKPCMQTYTRVAYMRWLKGDLKNAREVMADAAQAGSFRETEPMAWSYSRLAMLDLQLGDAALGLQEINTALRLIPHYALALLVRGKILLFQGNRAEAIKSLRLAANANPLPEYQWALADALRADGDIVAAQAEETKIVQNGAVNDPRTFSLYLATREKGNKQALKLAEDELENRRDIFTYDALAWAQCSNGNYVEAQANMDHALSEGTQDARLFYHAGVIASSLHKPLDAKRWFAKAGAITQMLLPSEKDGLAQQLSALKAAANRLSVNNQSQLTK